MDLHRALVGLRRAEDIALAHRDGRVARDQHLHHAADRLQPQRQWGDVVEHQVAQFTGEDAGLHRRTDRHHLIGIDRLAGLQRDQRAHHRLHHRHAGGPAHQHHIVDVFGGQAGIPQGALHRPQQAIQQIRTEALEGAPLEAGFDVERAVVAGGDEGQGNRCALHTAQFDLGLFGCFGEPLQRLSIASQVEPVLLLEGLSQPIHDATIPIVAAQLGVAAGGLHIEHPLRHPQHRHVERAAAQVEHQHPLHGAAIEAVRQGGGGGFVEDALHRDARQPTGVAGGLALGIVEIGGNGDHRRFHRLAQVGAGVVHQLAQDAGHQLFRRVLPLGGRADHANVALIVGAHRVGHREAAVVELLPLTAHESLEVREGIAGVEHQLAAGQLTHQQLLVLAETHHRRRGAAPFSAGDHLGAAPLQHGHHGIGGAQIDADYARHRPSPLSSCPDSRRMPDHSHRSPRPSLRAHANGHRAVRPHL